MFMIYNTVGMSVAQRRREIGILRALGLYQKEIRSLFVGEAMVLGALGGLLGIGLGSFLAHMVLQAIGATVSSMYVEVNVSTVDVSTGVALAAMGACLAATALSAYVPAREAAQTAPALSMQTRRARRLTQHALASRFKKLLRFWARWCLCWRSCRTATPWDLAATWP